MILIEHGFSVKGKRQTAEATEYTALAIHAYNIGRDAKNPALSARMLAEQIWKAGGLLEISADQESTIIVGNNAIRLVIVEDDEVMPAVRAWLAYYETQAVKGLDPLAATEGGE